MMCGWILGNILGVKSFQFWVFEYSGQGDLAVWISRTHGSRI